jgi:hypothetical protein
MEAIKAIENNLKLGIVSFSGFTIKTVLKNSIEKKDFKFTFSWKDIMKDNCMEQTNGNVAITCGKKSGISVIDFGNKESYNQAIQDFLQLKNHKQVETKMESIFTDYTPPTYSQQQMDLPSTPM